MACAEHEPRNNWDAQTSVYAGNSARTFRHTRTQTQDDIFTGWQAQTRRLCPIRQPVYQWRIYPWCSGQCTPYRNDRIQSLIGDNTPFPYVRTQCNLPCPVYIRVGIAFRISGFRYRLKSGFYSVVMTPLPRHKRCSRS